MQSLPRAGPIQRSIFWRCSQPAAIGMAAKGLDTSSRPARLVSMVLPVLHGTTNTRRGRSPNKALESDPAPSQPDPAKLRAGRFDVPQAAAPGSATLGL